MKSVPKEYWECRDISMGTISLCGCTVLSGLCVLVKVHVCEYIRCAVMYGSHHGKICDL